MIWILKVCQVFGCDHFAVWFVFCCVKVSRACKKHDGLEGNMKSDPFGFLLSFFCALHLLGISCCIEITFFTFCDMMVYFLNNCTSVYTTNQVCRKIQQHIIVKVRSELQKKKISSYTCLLLRKVAMLNPIILLQNNRKA